MSYTLVNTSSKRAPRFYSAFTNVLDVLFLTFIKKLSTTALRCVALSRCTARCSALSR